MGMWYDLIPDGVCIMQEFVGKLNLEPDERVLDVGCGIGGGDFYMAAEHGAFVHGLDLSSNMVLIALERTASTAGAAKVCLDSAHLQPRLSDLSIAPYSSAAFLVWHLLERVCLSGLRVLCPASSLLQPQQLLGSSRGSGSLQLSSSCVMQVSFEIADVTTYEVKKPLYDVVYSRDTLLHIQDKPALFDRQVQSLHRDANVDLRKA